MKDRTKKDDIIDEIELLLECLKVSFRNAVRSQKLSCEEYVCAQIMEKLRTL